MPEEKAPGPAVAAVAVAALVVGGVLGFLLGGGVADPDVSEDGQVSYACALAKKFRESHQDEDDWGPVHEDPAYNEVDAIPGLLGLAAPQSRNEDSAFTNLDWNAPREPGGSWDVGNKLDETIELCESR